MPTPFWGPDFTALEKADPEIADVVLGELTRVRGGLQLIASENLASPAVLAALGSTLSNKYAEGYPGGRCDDGCEQVDIAEELAIQRAKDLFDAEHANLRPHSGANANLAAYAAFCEPGDVVLAMDLKQGGHLTHGSKGSSASPSLELGADFADPLCSIGHSQARGGGPWFEPVPYGVRTDTELVDYDQVRDLALEHRPRMIIAGATAYPRLLDFAAFRQIADEVDAILMVDAAPFIGLVAGGVIPSPVPHADVVTFTTHKVLRGPRGGGILCRAEHAKAIDRAVFPFIQGGPLMHAVAAKAVALREAATPEYADYTARVVRNAAVLAEGLAAQGMRPVSGGTDTHLALLDLRELDITGADAEARAGAVGITLNRNAIPFDPAPPSVASGLRVGSACVTTQGMGELEMTAIAELIGAAVRGENGVGDQVRTLAENFPAYP